MFDCQCQLENKTPFSHFLLPSSYLPPAAGVLPTNKKRSSSSRPDATTLNNCAVPMTAEFSSCKDRCVGPIVFDMCVCHKRACMHCMYTHMYTISILTKSKCAERTCPPRCVGEWSPLKLNHRLLLCLLNSGGYTLYFCVCSTADPLPFHLFTLPPLQLPSSLHIQQASQTHQTNTNETHIFVDSQSCRSMSRAVKEAHCLT